MDDNFAKEPLNFVNINFTKDPLNFNKIDTHSIDGKFMKNALTLTKPICTPQTSNSQNAPQTFVKPTPLMCIGDGLNHLAHYTLQEPLKRC